MSQSDESKERKLEMLDILGPYSESQDAYFIALITGITPENQDFWCYLAVAFEKYDAYCLAEKQGNFDLEDFGVVLAYDLGKTPPADVKKAMKDKYKLDNDFENKLVILSELLDD